MRKRYHKPKMELRQFKVTDVLTFSVESGYNEQWFVGVGGEEK